MPWVSGGGVLTIGAILGRAEAGFRVEFALDSGRLSM
jgi:hypothetical protein